MPSIAAIEGVFKEQHRILDKLYNQFKPDEEFKVGVEDLMAQWGERRDPMFRAFKLFRELEIILRTGTGPNAGYAIMVDDPRKAHNLLSTFHDERLDRTRNAMSAAGRKGGATTKAKHDAQGGSILRHVAGPEVKDNPFEALRPLKKDESFALVEAARLYVGRKVLKAQKLKELRDGGIAISDDAIPLPIDDRMESVALVLPYIESVIDGNHRYEQLATRYRELERNFGQMRQSYEALKRWRDQQVAQAVEKVAVRGPSAPANGPTQSGAANGRAEDPARPAGAAGGPKTGPGQPAVDSREARAPQLGGETSSTAR